MPRLMRSIAAAGSANSRKIHATGVYPGETLAMRGQWRPG
jgi:hypothetical protein